MVLVQGAVWQAGRVRRLQINQSKTANESTLVVEILLLAIARISEILWKFLLGLFNSLTARSKEIPRQCLYGGDYDLLASANFSSYTPDLSAAQKW